MDKSCRLSLLERPACGQSARATPIHTAVVAEGYRPPASTQRCAYNPAGRIEKENREGTTLGHEMFIKSHNTLNSEPNSKTRLNACAIARQSPRRDAFPAAAGSPV